MNTRIHLISRLVAMLVLLSIQPIANAQVDTIEYLDEHYLHQWRDDSAAVCTHDGVECEKWMGRLFSSSDINYYSDVPSDISSYLAEIRYFNEYSSDIAAGFVLDSAITVIGYAVITDTLPGRYMYSNVSGVEDTTKENWKEQMRLYYFKSGELCLLKDTTVYYYDNFSRVKVSGFFGGNYYYSVSAGKQDKYCNLYEYFFETPVTITDSLYISFTRTLPVPTVGSTTTTVDRYLLYSIIQSEFHTYPTSEHRYPFNRFMYLNDSIGQWKHLELPAVMYVFPILELPGDSCPAVSGLHITGAYGSLVMAEWDTSANNSRWEVSYGPVGTEPDSGTIITCMEPVAKMLNLNVDSQYVAYVRPVCRFGITKRGEWSEGVVFNPLSGEVGIEQVADTEPLTLYPNPASGTVRIGLPEGLQGVDVRLYDMAGREVMRSTSLTLDVSHLPQGTYTVRAASATGTRTGRLVVAER